MQGHGAPRVYPVAEGRLRLDLTLAQPGSPSLPARRAPGWLPAWPWAGGWGQGQPAQSEGCTPAGWTDAAGPRANCSAADPQAPARDRRRNGLASRLGSAGCVCPGVDAPWPVTSRWTQGAGRPVPSRPASRCAQKAPPPVRTQALGAGGPIPSTDTSLVLGLFIFTSEPLSNT